MNTITTHVLDIAQGQPARDLGVRLERRAADGTSWRTLAQARTDEEGRIRQWPEVPTATAGVYRLTFATADHFADPFHPEISVTFNVVDATQHYHVPLLVSPFGYTTYRGT